MFPEIISLLKHQIVLLFSSLGYCDEKNFGDAFMAKKRKCCIKAKDQITTWYHVILA